MENLILPNPSSPHARAPITAFDIDGFKALYSRFDDATTAGLDRFYSPKIYFKDPVHKLQGIEQLRQYFRGLAAAANPCEFEFLTQIIAEDQAFLRWKMHYSHPRLAQGKPLILDGGSLIQFNSHIIYHEDFYDMGAMVYQHIPLLGWVVKTLNNGIASAGNE